MYKHFLAAGVAAAFLLLAWVFYVAANAVIPWTEQKQTVSSISITYQYGLWKARYCTPTCQEYSYSCDTGGSSSSTITLSTDSCSRLQAGRALMTLACILTPFAVILLGMILIRKKFQQPFLLMMKALNALCLLLGLSGTIMGSVATVLIGDSTQITNITIGTSIGLSIVGVVLNFIGLIVSFFVQTGSSAI